MKLNKILLGTVAMLAGFGAMHATAFAEETNREWVARTADQIKADLHSDQEGVSSYTIQWGDTLSALSLATDISVSQLAQINSIDNFNLIETGTVFYFNEDRTVLSIEKDNQVTSFNVENAQPVETPTENQEAIDANQNSNTTATESSSSEEISTSSAAVTSSSPMLYSLSQFMFNGVVNWNGLKFTYYSQSVLPGGGLNIPGRHVNEDGYVADIDGYIVLASSQPNGTIIDTPFGYQGKVYDSGTTGNHYDVYIR